MKWIASILMILNVFIFLKVSDRQVSNDQLNVQQKPDVNRESMLLLKEVAPVLTPDSLPTISAPGGEDLSAVIFDGRDLAQVVIDGDLETVKPALQLQSESDPETTVSSAVESAEPAIPEVPAMVAIDWSCYRVGPFKDTLLWDSAKVWASDVEFEFVPVRSESRELRAVRVYVGPFDSVANAQPEVELIKQKEFDHFVYMRDDNQARISLGYFTQEELASKFVEYLIGQGVDAKSQPEYRKLGPFDWMDLKIDSARRSELLDYEWGEGGISVVEKTCPAN